MVSKKIGEKEIGGRAEEVADQFFNELTKRNIALEKARENGCTHFLSIDTDEFYQPEQVRYCKDFIERLDLTSTGCKMRTFFKYPTCELLPLDHVNNVPFIYKIRNNLSFKLAEPYPVLFDPTRRLERENDEMKQ